MLRSQAAVTAVLVVAAVIVGGAVRPAAADETTIGYASTRTNWDAAEPGLEPSAVTATDFGQLYDVTLPRPAGQDAASYPNQVYAQPIVAHGTLVVATEENQVDGLDPASGTLLWSRTLGPSWTPLNCGDLLPRIGITSTPVYDPASDSVYVAAKTDDGVDAAHPHFRLHALDPQTGTERTGWPVTIAGTAANGGQVFNPATAHQRTGLLLLDGRVYLAFASHCDQGPYVGYVAGVDTTTRGLTLWSTESLTANDGGGIWQAGAGLMSDGPRRIFLTTGNGVAPAPGPGTSPPGSLGESVVRLSVADDGTLAARDFFSPADNVKLNNEDADLGSGGPVALPDAFGTPSHRHLLTQVGKDGVLWLLDRDSLGGNGQGPNGTDAVLGSVNLKGVWGRPAAFSTGTANYLYVLPSYSPLQAFRVGANGAGVPAMSAAGASASSFAFGSGSPIVTSSGPDGSSALVWVVTADALNAPAYLRAYPALPPTGLPWQPLVSFPLGPMAKFVQPATDSGRVYVATRDGRVLAFGRPTGTVLSAPSSDFGLQAVGTTSAPHEVTITANAPVTITGIAATNAFAAAAPSLPVTLDADDTLVVPVTFSPTSVGSASGLLHLTTSTSADLVNVALHGTGTREGLGADPAALDFGSVSTTQIARLGVTVQNTGATPTTIGEVTAPSGPFTVTGLPVSGQVLMPQESVTATVTFAPGAAGAATSQIVVGSSTGDLTVALTGTGFVGAPHLSVAQSVVDFRNVRPGAVVIKQVAVTNDGSANLTITKAAPPSAPFSVGAPIGEGQVIAPGDSLVLAVSYAPSSGGASTDSYQITANDGQGPQKITFLGNTHPWVDLVPSRPGCITVSNEIAVSGAPAVSRPCTKPTAQRFLLGPASSIRWYTIAGTWCLDLRNGRTVLHTPVQLWRCNGTAAQQWTWRLDNSLYNAPSGECLDVTGGSSVPGTPLQLYACTGRSEQKWDLSGLQAARGALSSGVAAAAQLCVADRGALLTDANPVQLNRCRLTPAQIVTHVGGALRVFGRCVTARGTTDGSPVTLYTCGGRLDQMWTVRADGSLVNRSSGRCLTDPQDSTVPGTALVLRACSATAGQRWRFVR